MSSRIIFILFSALIGIQNITRAEVPIFDAQMTKLRIAQESELSRDSYYFRFDNDMLALPSTDENYTMGIAMSWNTHRPLSLSSIDNDPLFIPLNLIRSLWLVPGTSGKEKENKPSDRSIILQDDAFTPFCLHSAPVCAAQGHPINQDRPYSNIIWTGVTYNYFNDELNEGRRTELDIGILGTSIGKDVQTAIHERCCRDKIPPRVGNSNWRWGITHISYQANQYCRITPILW